MMESQVKSSQVVLMLLLSSLLVLSESTIEFVWSVGVEWFVTLNPNTVNVEIVLEMSWGCDLLGAISSDLYHTPKMGGVLIS